MPNAEIRTQRTEASDDRGFIAACLDGTHGDRARDATAAAVTAIESMPIDDSPPAVADRIVRDLTEDDDL